MTTDVKDLVARLALQPEDIGGPSRVQMMREREEAASALEAQAEEIGRLKDERAFAIREMSKWASACGEAEGRLKASEWPGVVDGWKERAEAAERERAEEWRKRREAECGRDVSDAAAMTLREERDALKDENERLREVLMGLELACEQLAASRSARAYLIMLEDGQSDALLRLDVARAAARAAIHPTPEGERR